MPSYTAILTLAQPPTDDLVDAVHDGDLDTFDASVSETADGHARITITVEAADLLQATVVARSLFTRPTLPDPIRLDLLAQDHYPDGDDTIPELMSVTEVAQLLGITRQGTLGLAERGSLTARKVGERQWVISAASARQAATRRTRAAS